MTLDAARYRTLTLPQLQNPHSNPYEGRNQEQNHPYSKNNSPDSKCNISKKLRFFLSESRVFSRTGVGRSRGAAQMRRKMADKIFTVCWARTLTVAPGRDRHQGKNLGASLATNAQSYASQVIRRITRPAPRSFGKSRALR